MDNRGYDLDLWEEIVEITVNIEAKTSLQPSLGIRVIDSRCPKGYSPTKKDKSS